MTTRGRWLFAVLAASAVLLSGCSDAAVDPKKLPGVYRDDGGGRIELSADGTFSASRVTTREGGDPVDFSGSWDYEDPGGSSDFVYLGVEDGGLGMTGGIQLYVDDEDTLYFQSDPDGPVTQELKRTS
ncbi:hypothetical protein LZP81_31335 [Streptomyces parvulus]|uniref:Uncharacterized protein n=1 Tax=Streptomyces parvulus TaxID=146923 RepID=A0A191V6I8_9ACTN|nr:MULTISPECIES: hypothetical protein [Streptomyces]ANJ10535.1 hypothetical protein Spa2297_28280 [Streptomyces parvulus]MCC9158549.1 hypothetical protein [Streptomyces parvulus]MCE7691350.1 hypothetical protein [Streptomyces parvulus]MZD59448.1 hypothetical protein [Streptomyces sp. SID5606]WHM35129.1 hypothetical protein OH540_05090 [Streptomyces sp. BPPL-273]